MCDPNNFTCPHENFVTSGLPTRNRIQQNVGVGETQVGNLLVLRTPVEPWSEYNW